MSGFLTPLDTRKLGSQTYLLLDDLVYANDKFTITVKKNFDFDGASIPKMFWSIIGSPMTGNYARAACLHDALYASMLFSREDCDKLFLEAMGSDGVGKLLRNTIYRAVRIGGKWAYEEHEELQKYRNLITLERNNG